MELDEYRDRARETYDRVAAKYAELFRNEMREKDYDRRLLDRFAASFGPGALIYDLGCGPAGHIGRYLFDKQAGLEVRGIDISPRCVAMAREANPAMTFAVGDIARLDLPDASVDGILSYYATIHIPRRLQQVVFAEFARVLRPGGLVLTVVKKGPGEGFIDELLGIPARIYFAHFSEDDMVSYLRDAGLDVAFLQTRRPYEFEISDERIYAIGRRPGGTGPGPELSIDDRATVSGGSP